jgi:hypothetical protein
VRWTAILLALALAAPARAELPTVQKPASFSYRKLGVGLLIGGAVLVALGGVFVGLAADANSSALDNGQFHPNRAADRDHFQATHTALFTVGAGALVTGLIFVLDGPRP